jgi:hypothetical protein
MWAEKRVTGLDEGWQMTDRKVTQPWGHGERHQDGINMGRVVKDNW